MTWFRVDDKLHDHPKFRKLRTFKLPALGLWTACGSWSADNLSDGFVPSEIVQRFDPDEGLAKRLVEVRLWELAEHDGEEGYRFHQWTDHQPTRDVVERRRAEARERMRKLRAGESGSKNVRANSERTSTNTFASTDANDFPNYEPPGEPCDFYEPSNESPQVQDSVRTNGERTSKNVRDPRPDPTRSSYGTSSGTAKTRGTRIPDNFTVTPDMVEWARRECPLVDGRFQTQQFIDYWMAQPGKSAVKLDWKRTWQRWMRKEQNDLAGREGRHLNVVRPPIPSDPDAAFADLLDRADARAAARLIGASWMDEDKPPSEPGTQVEWARARSRAFIREHETQVRAALSERKTG